MDMLGWFWGTIHTMMKANPKMTIAEALGEGKFFECRKDGCNRPFQTQLDPVRTAPIPANVEAYKQAYIVYQRYVDNFKPIFA
jgi:hypothetical protein